MRANPDFPRFLSFKKSRLKDLRATVSPFPAIVDELLFKGASRRQSQNDPSELIHWIAGEYFHMSHSCTNPSFYAVTRNCTCLKRGEKGVSDPALLDNADGSQAVGMDGGHRSSTFGSREAAPFLQLRVLRVPIIPH